MNIASLRFRMVAWTVCVLAIALAIFSASVFLGVRQFLTLSLQRHLRSMTGNIETFFLDTYSKRGEAWVVGEIREAYSGGSDRYVRVLLNGNEIYRSGDLRDPVLRIATLPLPPPRAKGFRRVPGARDVLEFVDPYTTPDGLHFVVITGAAENTMSRVLGSLGLIIGIVCPVVLIFAAVGGFIFITGPLRPVLVLTEQAEHIGRDQLGERLPVPKSGDELQRLAVALNRMIERLEDARAHNNRFSADASHELRTPLTIIRGELEQAIQEPELSTSAVESIGSALEEIDRMSQIVRSLMATAYLDSGGEQMMRERTDLSRLVTSTIEQMSLLAEERGITLTGDTSGPLYVDGDPTRLKQVIVNLIDNAIKYNLHGGTVVAAACAKGGKVILSIADTGLGIPEESLPRIFDRFYRSDKARSRTTGGIGIGLSIVKAICNAHEADIHVESQEGRGTTFTVSFALSGEQSATSRAGAAPSRTVSHLDDYSVGSRY